MTIFALEPATFEALQRAYRSPNPPTAAERLAFIESHSAASQPRVSTGTAEIDVVGILTKTPDIISMLFGGGNTTYEGITSQLDAAERDPAVRDVVLNVDSPGGQVDGLFPLLDRISSFSKPIKARASNAMSGAYAIAAATGSIEATHAASQFGSIGVATAMFVSDRVVHISSTDSPKKRPDVTTEAGKATVREHLDDIHGLFVSAIAKGRKTTTAKVNSTFGRGGIVLAAAAKKAGMIDSIASSPTKKSKSATAQRTTTMKFSLSDLKSTNPALYEQFTAIAVDNAEALFREVAGEGFAEGYNEVLEAERSRCVQHVECAARAGDPMFAFDAVESGAPFDEHAVSNYTARAAALPQYRGGRLVSGGELPQSTSAPDVGDFVVAEMLRRRGKTAEADAIAPAPAPAMALATTPRKMTDAELQKEIVELMAQRGRGR